MRKHFWDNNQELFFWFKDALSRELASSTGRWHWSMNVSKAAKACQSVWKWPQDELEELEAQNAWNILEYEVERC